MFEKKQNRLRLLGYFSIGIGIAYLYIPAKFCFQSTLSLVQTAPMFEQLFRLSIKLLRVLIFINIPLAAIVLIFVGYRILKETKNDEN